MISGRLTRPGIVTANSGSEALQVFERFRPEVELIVSDVVLPGIGGLEVSKMVREMGAELPVILMSGYPLGDEARSKLADGTTDWITKPFSSDELARIISRVMVSRGPGNPDLTRRSAQST